MEKTLDQFGFKKDGLYSWVNYPFHITTYFDGLTITKQTDKGDIVLYEGITPRGERESAELIEHHTKLKNKKVIQLLDSTKNSRIFTNTSLYISSLLINYFKYNNVSEDDVCKKLEISKGTLKSYLTGNYDFKLTELTKISLLVGKSITIK